MATVLKMLSQREFGAIADYCAEGVEDDYSISENILGFKNGIDVASVS
jgi:hypothetical protein